MLEAENIHPLQELFYSLYFVSDQIFKIQYTNIRTITCSEYRAHTEPLFKFLTLKYINKCVIMYGMTNYLLISIIV